MKKIILSLALSVFVSQFGFAQDTPQTESAKLTQQSYALYQEGKFDEAIALAEKVVEKERNAPNRNWENLATTITNLALLKKEHYWILRKDLANPAISTDDLAKSGTRRIEYLQSIEALLREAIGIYDNKLKIETIQLATIKFELAAFLNRLGGPFSDAKSTGASEVEKLYADALALREKLLGDGDEQTIFAMMSLVDFCRNSANFEKALPLYQRLISVIEKKYGKNSEHLPPVLRAYANLLITTEQKAEAVEIVNRISSITGRAENLPEADFDLSRRNTKDKLQELIENPNTISEGMKKQKWLQVRVLIDEKGKVLEAKAAETPEKDFKGKNVMEKAEKEVLEWRFKPLLVEGAARKMRGVIWYPYLVKG